MDSESRRSASIRARSSSTDISRSAPPSTSTSATPGTCSRPGLITSSVNLRISDNDRSPLTVYVRMAAAETSRRPMEGSSVSLGSLARICATRSRTWVAASWMGVDRVKNTITVDNESRE